MLPSDTMKYLVNLTPLQVQKIQEQVHSGQYENVAHFLQAAIENQIFLQTTAGGSITDLNGQMETSFGSLNLAVTALSASPPTLSPPAYKELVFASQNLLEEQAWLWGQINKIFPVKLGLRVLHQVLDGRPYTDLDAYLEIAAREASALGKKIRSYEDGRKKLREERISAGLPSADDNSRNRYMFQFLAYKRKDGLLDGAMALMRFCQIQKVNGKQVIGLTEKGLEFCHIENPVLDKNEYSHSLGREEATCYLGHIKNGVKGEHLAIRWMLSQLNSGISEREALNTEVKRRFGAIWGKTTPAVLNTQRSGLIARMYELGLVNKKKTGIYISYGLTDMGRKYL